MDEFTEIIMNIKDKEYQIKVALASLQYCLIDKKSLDDVSSIEEILESVARDRIKLYG